MDVLYTSVYEKPNHGRRIILISMLVFVGLLLTLLITLAILLFKICRQNSRTGDATKSGAVKTPGVGVFDAKYTKVAAANPN